MKKLLFAVPVIAMAVLASCSKVNPGSNAPSQEGFNISILGEMGEFAATKSTAESCIRLKWENDDIVLTYGNKDGEGIAHCGNLTVTVEEENPYVAIMSGTLNFVPSDGKLYLLHCPLYNYIGNIKDGAVKVSLAIQSNDCVPFVAYATVTGVSAEPQSNLKANFKFASSVIKANVYGLPASTVVNSVKLTNVNTDCKITFGEEITVAGENVGTVARTLGTTSSSASGKYDFFIAVPAIESSSSRTFIVNCSDKKRYAKTGAVTKAHAANSYINTICDLTYVETSIKYADTGLDGVEINGIIWAPVNCGYDADNYKYGRLYQWGRKYGQGYAGLLYDEDGEESPYEDSDYPGKVGGAQSKVKITSKKTTHPDGDTYNGEFYYGLNYWYGGTEPAADGLWSATKTAYDPCPEGWRVPTYSELKNLKGGASHSRNIQKGSHGCLTECLGSYYNGSEDANPESGIFLPSAGEIGNDVVIDGRGDWGGYWSSTTYDNDKDKGYYLSAGYSSGLSPSPLFMGYSVRCVKVEE